MCISICDGGDVHTKKMKIHNERNIVPGLQTVEKASWDLSVGSIYIFMEHTFVFVVACKLFKNACVPYHPAGRQFFVRLS